MAGRNSISPEPDPEWTGPFPTIRERRRGEGRIWRIGIALSVLAHVLVFVLWPSGSVDISPDAAAGPRSGSPEAAAGGMQAVNVRAPAEEIVTPPPPAPVPTVEPVDPVEIEDEVTVDASAILGEQPGLEEPGREIGTGQGDGGAAEEGRFSLVPPSPRGMIVPPSNDELRGSEISVWVFVDETGQVVPDSTRLEPPTRDRDFNERLMEEAAEWIFEPAREGGEPVGAWFPYTIRM
ncbi:MAG: hypothetical protein R3223_10210 [Longimicrobiales bacterium]|nr:hypothetical protein [Longimicrobiales bacterium]